MSIIEGTAYPLGLDDVDTDMIIPAEWLKTVGRTGFADGVFAPLRAGGDSLFDDPRLAGSPILIAGRNFGCGSSREHAVWALLELGIRAVLARSFSDIFASNAFKNGMLAIALEEQHLARLLQAARGSTIRLDLLNQVVATAAGDRFAFDFDSFRKDCLIRGIDEIGLTELQADKIECFESRTKADRPFLQEVQAHKTGSPREAGRVL